MTNLDYLYNPDASRTLLKRDYFVKRKLGFKVIERGMILPHKGNGGLKNLGGIIDRNGKFIQDTSATYYTGGTYTPPP